MSYWDISEMAADPDLTQRCAACAAAEDIPDPYVWATENQLALCASPGWDAAWASFQAANPGGQLDDDGNPLPAPRPGKDPGVISDAMILSATQALS